jgi:predicted DNA-binding WGR domain protein
MPGKIQPEHHIEAHAMNAVHLRRIDPARNMCRFYRLDVQPDLFDGVLLVKEWGRIGARGRMVAEPHDSEALAAVALRRHAERKRRRGYQVANTLDALQAPQAKTT